MDACWRGTCRGRCWGSGVSKEGRHYYCGAYDTEIFSAASFRPRRRGGKSSLLTRRKRAFAHLGRLASPNESTSIHYIALLAIGLTGVGQLVRSLCWQFSIFRFAIFVLLGLWTFDRSPCFKFEGTKASPLGVDVRSATTSRFLAWSFLSPNTKYLSVSLSFSLSLSSPFSPLCCGGCAGSTLPSKAGRPEVFLLLPAFWPLQDI